MVKPTQVVLIVRHKIAVVLNLAAVVLALVAMYNRSPENWYSLCYMLDSIESC